MSEAVRTDTSLAALSGLPWPESCLDVNSEDAFHGAFIQFCAEKRETDPQRLLARFIRYHDRITDFITVLDDSKAQLGPRSLHSYFWPKAFEGVLKAFETIRRKDVYYRQYLPILSGVIPAFGDELSRFPWNMAVQKPLQQIFVVYMQCYEYMLQTFRDFPGKPATGLRVFADYVDQASHAIVRLEAEWEGAIAEASQEEVPAGLTQSEFSYFNGTLGPLRPKMTRALFEWQDTLGQGTFGQVSKVRETTTGTLYAQKTIRVIDQALKARIEKEVKNEVDIMQKLRHHHIASIQFHIFDGDTYSIMMLPVADCDLRQFLRRCVDAEYPSGDIAYLTSWFRCLISALAYAHSRNIKHEDIKPANILIKDHQPYLTDFGCAKDFSGWDSSTSMDTLTFGTPVYWAPESQPRGRGADVFSLGCVFSEMLTVIYKRSLRDYQDYRYVQDGENAYAFRENLAKVRDWLDDIVPQSQSTGILIKEQTLQMLEPDVERRKKARDIVDSFRVLGNGICATC